MLGSHKLRSKGELSLFIQNKKCNRLYLRHVGYWGVIFFGLLYSFAFANTSTVVVETLSQIPDQNGQFMTVGSGAINITGTIIFSSRLTDTPGGEDDNSGIFKISTSSVDPSVTSIKQVVREGSDLLIGNESFTIGDLYPFTTFYLNDAPLGGVPVVGDLDNIVIELPLVPGSGQFGDSIIAVETEQGFELVAQEGDIVDGLDGRYKSHSPIGLSGNNDVTFFSSLDETDNSPLDNTALFNRYNNGDIVKLVRKGESANVGMLTQFGGIFTNNFGSSVFNGVNENENDRANSGIYQTTTNSYFLIVHEGDQAPIDSEQTHYFTQFQHYKINNENEIGFIAEMRDENGFSVPYSSGLFTKDEFGITPILLEGQSTPDSTATFRDFLGGFAQIRPRPTFNDNATFAFRIPLLTPTSQTVGVFKASADEVFEIARKGETYEGSTFNNFEDPVINNNDLVVFKADLITAIDSSEQSEGGVIIENVLIMSDGIHLETIAKAGDIYGTKQITNITFNNSNQSTANGLNDNGQVVYGVRYDDGSRAIHLFTPSFGWRDDVDDGSWDDVDNWKFAGVPDESSDIEFNFDSNLSIQGPQQPTTVNSLSIGKGNGNISLNLQDTSFTVTESLDVGTNGNLFVQGQLISDINIDGKLYVSDGNQTTITGNIVNNGMIDISENAEIQLTGDYSGKGSIQGSGTITIGGNLLLGNIIEEKKIESSVNFSTTSRTILKIDGVERGATYDAISIDLNANLGGTLELVFAENFNVSSGIIFELIRATQITGSFDNVILPTLTDTSLQLSVEQTDTSIQLVVSDMVANPPAPTPSPEQPPEIIESVSAGVLSLYWVLLLISLIIFRKAELKNVLARLF